MTGSYLYYPTLTAPRAPGVAGVFGGSSAGYGQAGEIVGTLIGAAATLYQLDLQRRLMKSTEHQAARDQAAAAALAAQQAAAQQANMIQTVANQQASGGAAPTGGSVLTQLQGIPPMAWVAVGGGVLLLMLMRGRRA